MIFLRLRPIISSMARSYLKTLQISFVGVTLIASLIGATFAYRTLSPDLLDLTPTSSSWNPAINCKAVVLTVEELIGIVPNPTQTVPNVGADYSGGALPLAGRLPPGSNPDTHSPYGLNWPFWKRALDPPCEVTLPDGTVLPTLVEIRGVKVLGFRFEESDGDSTWNIGEPKLFACTPIKSPLCPHTYPDTMHRVHAEVDIVWKTAGIAPPLTLQTGDLIDIQGFVFWDSVHLDEGWHSYSGWEIHPVTAWRYAEPLGIGV